MIGGKLLNALFAGTVVLAALLRWAPWTLGDGELVRTVKRLRPTSIDLSKKQRGYYEELANEGRPTLEFAWGTPSNEYRRCVDGDGTTSQIRPNTVIEAVTTDHRNYRLVAGFDRAKCYGGVRLRTNKYGFRGPEWTERPAPGVTRIAVLGSSYVMGSGVAAEDTFPAQLEKRLNASGNGKRYEVLNVGILGYAPLDQIPLAPAVLALNPDVVVLSSIDGDTTLTRQRLTSRSQRMGMPESKAAQLPPVLKAFWDEAAKAPSQKVIVDATLESTRLVVEAYRDKVPLMVVAVWPLLGIGNDRPPQNLEVMTQLVTTATKAGAKALDLRSVWDGYDEMELWVEDWDNHPSPYGHEIMGKQLADAMRPLLDALPPKKDDK